MERSTLTKSGIRLTDRVSAMQVSPTLAVMNRALELKAQGVDITGSSFKKAVVAVTPGGN